MGYPNVARLLASDNFVHNVWQTAELGNVLTSSAGAETDLARAFTINDIQGISSWLSVFDQYKIKEIELWITPSSSSQTVVDNFRLLTVIDYDDSVTPTFNGLLQYSNVTDSGRNEGVYRRWSPHVQVGQASAGSTVNSRNQVADWTDSATTSTTHYGVKISMTATTTTVVIAFRVRFHIQFRNNI